MGRERGRGAQRNTATAATTAANQKAAASDLVNSSSADDDDGDDDDGVMTTATEEEEEEEEEEREDDKKDDDKDDKKDDNKERKVETLDARRRRIKDENMAMARARAVREKVRALTQRANAAAIGEQKRKATHWSYVLAEMRWLARDFAAERDWKLEAARQVALTAAVANGVPVGANERRNQRYAKASRQVAKQVSQFWETRWEEAKTMKLPEATELAKLGCGGKRFALEASETHSRLQSSAQAQTSQRLHRAAVNAAAGGGGDPPQTPKSEDPNTRTNSTRSTPTTNVSTPLSDVTGYGEDSRRDDDEMFLVSFDPKTPEIPQGDSMKGIEKWAVKYLHRLASLEKAKAVRQAVDAREAEDEDDEETTKGGVGRKGRQRGGGANAKNNANNNNKEEKPTSTSKKENKRKRDATPEPHDTDADDMETDVDTEGGQGALSTPEKREQRRAMYAKELKLDDGGLALGLDNLIAPYSMKKKFTMRGLKSFKRGDEAAKKEGGSDDDGSDDDQSMSSGGKNGEDDDDEKSDDAEDFFFDFPALQYDAYGRVKEEFAKKVIDKEANKFADYERRLREWEDRERTRESHLRAQQKSTTTGTKDAGKDAGKDADGIASSEDRRRAFFAAAAARGHFFDQEGYVVDKNGKRKKNKKGQYVRFHPGMEEQFGVKKNGKKKEGGKGSIGGERKGAAKPWTASEDALLCAIVHEFGSNWALVADAFGASASLKGSYRRPELCRWRFQQLTRAVELENDPGAFAALNLDKGSARVVMSRSLPLEDETARLHFQAVAHSCSSYAKIRRAALRERVGMDPQKRIKPHQSWKDCVKLFSLKSPVELAHMEMNPVQQQQRMQQGAPQIQMQGQVQGQIQMTGLQPMPSQMQQMSAHVQQQQLARVASKTEAVAAIAAQAISPSAVPQLHRMGSYDAAKGKGQAAMSVGGMVGSSPARPRGGGNQQVSNVPVPNLSPLGSVEKQTKQGLAPGNYALTPKSAEKDEKKSKEQVIAEKTTVTRTGRATKKVKK